MNWRPDCWVNPHDFRNPDHVDNPYVEMECANSYKAGASAMLSAVLKWLDDACPHGTLSVDTSKASRRECPQCMAELRGEK